MKIFEKILSGGSLGSYVDEGRSKMREIVWIAGHIEHRYSERKLQSEACLRSTPVWGSLINLSNLGVGNIECVVRHSFWLKFVVLIIETLDFITKSSVLESASFLTSDQTRTLAEFKHIIKRRKRN